MPRCATSVPRSSQPHDRGLIWKINRVFNTLPAPKAGSADLGQRRSTPGHPHTQVSAHTNARSAAPPRQAAAHALRIEPQPPSRSAPGFSRSPAAPLLSPPRARLSPTAAARRNTTAPRPAGRCRCHTPRAARGAAPTRDPPSLGRAAPYGTPPRPAPRRAVPRRVVPAAGEARCLDASWRWRRLPQRRPPAP